MIEISLRALQLYRLSETSYCLLKIALPIQTYPFIVIGISITGVNLDGGGVVVDGSVELADLVIGETPVKEGFEVRGQDLQGLAVELDR